MTRYKQHRKQRRHKAMGGVPSGYRHIWKYKGIWDETKGKNGVWNVNFRATKGKHSKSYGQFKKGFKIVWAIKGIQIARKTGRGTYQTRLIAKKKRIRSGYK